MSTTQNLLNLKIHKLSKEQFNQLDNPDSTAIYLIPDDSAETFYVTAGQRSDTEIGDYATAEGYDTVAEGMTSHAEGYSTQALGEDSHAEGCGTIASGPASHAEGYHTIASGGYSSAHGQYTTATSENQFVVGQYNADKSDALFIVGNGQSDASRSNAFEVYAKDGDGNHVGAKVSGDMTADTFTATSDARLKKNIVDYTPANSILALPVKEFDYINSNLHTIGCLAQDLQKICPEIVTEDPNTGYLAIQESKIVYLLLEEVKKLKEEVSELRNNLFDNK